ncbi:MAG TPA: glycoside hydrolase family 3 N-terminal domain-containing protein [Beutenbergiaceae bacterium]|nr:glycoside hydrolase family 3 N-terminal domain-containing protein [Beutenbergiaceae bacterium]
MSAKEDLQRSIHGVLLPGFNGTTPPPWLWAAASEGLAGVLLFGENTPSPERTAELTAQLQHRAPRLLISSDEEGGDVSRVQASTGSFLPGACALGQAGDEALTRRAGRAQGRLLRATGIDLPLTPVLDVASEPANPVIGVRAYDSDPGVVARHGRATIIGLREAGVATCAKHFPGHGDTAVDSHLALPTLNIDPDLLHRRDLHPFSAAIDAGVDSVMTGHLVVPALGPNPASLEPAVTTQLRRMGHQGPIITDALDMAALHEGAPDAGPGTTGAELIAEASVRALMAGADLLCLGSTSGRDDAEVFHTVRDGIERAVRAGRVDPAALAASAERNRALGAAIRHRQKAAPSPDLPTALAELEQVGAAVAAAAVRTRGNVRLRPGDALVDLRRGVNIAAGRDRVITDALTAGAGLVSVALADLPQWAVANPDRRVAVLTRNIGDEMPDPLRDGPDVVVIHVGVPGARPDAPNRVLAHGSGLANSREVVRRITQ